MDVYIDSCVLIYLVEGTQAAKQRISANLLTDPNLLAVFTELTRLECRVKPISIDSQKLLADYDEFFATPGYRCLDFDQTVFELATTLRALHRLKTPDAMHLAAAITAGCTEFWTNDDRLAKAAGEHLRIVTYTP